MRLPFCKPSEAAFYVIDVPAFPSPGACRFAHAAEEHPVPVAFAPCAAPQNGYPPHPGPGRPRPCTAPHPRHSAHMNQSAKRMIFSCGSQARRFNPADRDRLPASALPAIRPESIAAAPSSAGVRENRSVKASLPRQASGIAEKPSAAMGHFFLCADAQTGSTATSVPSRTEITASPPRYSLLTPVGTSRSRAPSRRV